MGRDLRNGQEKSTYWGLALCYCSAPGRGRGGGGADQKMQKEGKTGSVELAEPGDGPFF